ncbi:unnamed protein product [Pedinophyceae sp. YPF-701]|nr:unnamed protein product [Pedinophyceae sp. YPF-701]
MTSRPKRILLTNDDGADSPFFNAWVDHLRSLGLNIVVASPSGPQSFASKAVSKGPLTVTQPAADVYHISGSPAACVNIALYSLNVDCDLIISGPNIGHNAGRAAVLSSGTIGAAMEGALADVRSIAVSFPFFAGFNNWPENEIEASVSVAAEICLKLWDTWPSALQDGPDACLPEHLVYNVNVPLGAGVTDVPALIFGGAGAAPQGAQGGSGAAQNSSWETFDAKSGDGGLAEALRPTTEPWFATTPPGASSAVPVHVTTVDPATGYRSLFAEQEPESGPPESGARTFVWSPKGLRVFQSRETIPDGDVRAIQSGAASISPLHVSYRPMRVALPRED